MRRGLLLLLAFGTGSSTLLARETCTILLHRRVATRTRQVWCAHSTRRGGNSSPFVIRDEDRDERQ